MVGELIISLDTKQWGDDRMIHDNEGCYVTVNGLGGLDGPTAHVGYICVFTCVIQYIYTPQTSPPPLPLLLQNIRSLADE